MDYAKNAARCIMVDAIARMMRAWGLTEVHLDLSDDGHLCGHVVVKYYTMVINHPHHLTLEHSGQTEASYRVVRAGDLSLDVEVRAQVPAGVA